MASTFAELFSDFQDIARLYTEQLNVTELNFMRLYTRGIQDFQRKTEFVEKIMQVTRQATPPYYVMPLDALRLVEIRDHENKKILLQDFTQWYGNVDQIPTGKSRTPTQHDRLQFDTPTTIMGTWNRQMAVAPEIDYPFIVVHYIPDMQAITAPTNPVTPTAFDTWAAWFPFDSAAFDTQFRTARLTPVLAPFEQAFSEYALAQFIRSKGSQNYVVFERTYDKAVQEAIANKPLYWKSGFRDYYMAPWS